jgi:murein L,D-transpeptidase YafK
MRMLENDDQNPVVNTIHGYEDGDGFTIVTRRYRKTKAVINNTIKCEQTSKLKGNKTVKTVIAEKVNQLKNKTAVKSSISENK